MRNSLIKICHINYFAVHGGAAIAAMRLHQALLEQKAASSFMAVVHENQPGVIPLGTPGKYRLMRQFQRLVHYTYHFAKSTNYSGHTFEFFPGRLLPEILNRNPDIIHLHGIVGEMMSVPEIGKLCRHANVVWTFHDGWPYNGTEQYFIPGTLPRYRDGYTRDNHTDGGLDLDRFYWNRKCRHWENMPLHIISPSGYLAREIRESILFHNTPLTIIPHGLSADEFAPGDRNLACAKLHLNPAVEYIGLAAVDFRNRVKGGDLVQTLLAELAKENKRTVLLVAGNAPDLAALQSASAGQVHCLGPLRQQEMKFFYQTLTMFFNPTRLESFGLTNLEALSSGIPVLSTNRGAVPEVVEHLLNGYLSDPEDISDFLRGIDYIRQNRSFLSQNARRAAVEKFSAKRMAAEHIALYQKIIEQKKKNNAEIC